MKRFIKRIFPVLLSAFILVSTGWYLLEYDPGFTRDILLQQARHLEESGRHNAAVWMYNLAYEYFGSNDAVAIELADKFIEEQIGYPITMVSNGPGRDDIIYR